MPLKLLAIKPYILTVLAVVYTVNLGTVPFLTWLQQLSWAALIVVIDTSLHWLLTRTPRLPVSAAITALIVVLVADPGLPLEVWPFLVLLAVLPKYFLRPGGRHLFNPAALALFTTSLIFPAAASWWGVGGPIKFWLLLILVGLALVHTFKRWFVPLIFLASFAVFTIVLSGPPALQPLWLGLAGGGEYALFLLIMLVEPLTAPVGQPRLVWGAALAGLVAALSAATLPVDYLLLSLMAMNIIGRILGRVPSSPRVLTPYPLIPGK